MNIDNRRPTHRPTSSFGKL